jgi:hypothetical protein
LYALRARNENDLLQKKKKQKGKDFAEKMSKGKRKLFWKIFCGLADADTLKVFRQA